jgi:hypothetical protein
MGSHALTWQPRRGRCMEKQIELLLSAILPALPLLAPAFLG